MTLEIQPPETDLIGTDPTERRWEPHTVHTHYFGFQVPDARIGGFTYIRYQPYFPLCQGSVIIFQGTDNIAQLDVAYLDWEMAMPYPVTDGNVITTANGYQIEFLELGRSARITYASRDGRTSFELLEEAVTPLIARGAVIPGENLLTSHEPGGSEQYMHVTGALKLNGESFDVDCYMPRDRSWRQSRTEARGGRHDPPSRGRRCTSRRPGWRSTRWGLRRRTPSRSGPAHSRFPRGCRLTISRGCTTATSCAR